MLLVAVFDTPHGVMVRSTGYSVSLNDYPTMGFMKLEELVKEQAFKQNAVAFVLQKFNQSISDLHTIVVSNKDRNIVHWRRERGHFNKIRM